MHRLLLCVLLAAGSASATAFYGFSDNNQFGVLDVDAGVFNVISSPWTYGFDVVGMALINGTYYVSASGNNPPLYTLNPNAGTLTQIATVNDPAAFQGTARLSIMGSTDQDIWVRAVSSGNTGRVSTLGTYTAVLPNLGSSVAFSTGGSDLYVLAFASQTNSNLFRLNMGTNQYDLIGATGVAARGFERLAFYGNTLYAVTGNGNQSIYTVNTTTGQFTFLRNYTGASFFRGLAEVPEPSTIGLLTAGLALMAWKRRAIRGRVN